MTLSRTTLSRMTLSRTTFSRMTLGRMLFIIMTLRTERNCDHTDNEPRHLNQQSVILFNVVILNVVAPKCCRFWSFIIQHFIPLSLTRHYPRPHINNFSFWYLDFGPKLHIKHEQDWFFAYSHPALKNVKGFLINLITVQSHPVPSKKSRLWKKWTILL